MASQRIERLKLKIEEANKRIMVKIPAFGMLLKDLRFVMVKDMKKASINGSTVFFSGKYVDVLTEKELDYLLCHLVTHVLMGHLERPHDLAGASYHHVCDMLVNTSLLELIEIDGRNPHLGKVFLCPEKFHELPTPEELLAYIPYRLATMSEIIQVKFLMDTDDYWEIADEDVNGVEIIGASTDEKGLADETGGALSMQKRWQLRLAAAVQSLAGEAIEDIKNAEKNEAGHPEESTHRDKRWLVRYLNGE